MAIGLPKARVYGGGSGGGGDARAAERVVSAGMIYRYASDGVPWRYKGVSMFRALQRWDRGEDLMPLVNWTKDVGGTLWRVFCQFHRGIALTDADIFPGLEPSRVAEFCRWLASMGIRPGLVFLADCAQFGQGHDHQRDRLRRLHDACAPTHGFGECWNEPFKNSNGIDIEQCVRDAGLVTNRQMTMATGNYDVENHDSILVLDSMYHHPSRKPDWPVESGKEGYFLFEGWDAIKDDGSRSWYGGCDPATVVNDEPMGAGEVQTGSRDTNPANFEDAGAGYAIGSGGGTFHSTDGIQSVVPGPTQTTCARAFFRAMDYVPLETPTGSYTHGGYPNHPLYETTDGSIGEDAGRIAKDGRTAYVVCAQPKPGWSGPKVKPGWRVVESFDNGRGNIIKLERS